MIKLVTGERIGDFPTAARSRCSLLLCGRGHCSPRRALNRATRRVGEILFSPGHTDRGSDLIGDRKFSSEEPAQIILSETNCSRTTVPRETIFLRFLFGLVCFFRFYSFSIFALRVQRSLIAIRRSEISVETRATSDRNRVETRDRNTRATDATVGNLRTLAFINSNLREGGCALQ